MSSIPNQFTRKLQPNTDEKLTKKSTIKSKYYEHYRRENTQNAKINTLKNDKKVVNFSVAINDSYKTKQGERKEQTTYYNCSYWINAKIAEYLVKGTLVELSGRISSSAWIGKDGEIKSGLNFHTSNIKLHGGKQKSEFNNEPTTNQQSVNDNLFSDETDDDLPF